MRLPRTALMVVALALASCPNPDESGLDAARHEPDAATRCAVSEGGLGGLCSEDCWCWEAPLPQGNNLHDVWLGEGKALFAGFSTFFEWDGQHWRNLPSPGRRDLRAIWGLASNDLWAATDDGVYRFDGAQWTRSANHVFSDLAGAANDDIWGINLEGLHHWDGKEWTRVADGLMRAMWVAGPGEVFAASTPTCAETLTIYHAHDGALETTQAVDLGDTVSMSGTSASDIWLSLFGFGNKGGEVWHFDGRAWTQMSFTGPLLGACPLSVVADEGGKAWLANCELSHFDGTAWSKVELPGDGAPSLERLRRRAGELFTVGDNGRILRYDGSAWTALSTGHVPSIRSLWSDRSGNAWATAGAPFTVLKREPSGWKAVWSDADSVAGFVAGTSDHDVWTFRSYGADSFGRHWDGTAWSDDIGLSGMPYALYMGSAASGWGIGGCGEAWNWNGTAWQGVAHPFGNVTGCRTPSLAGTGASDVWATNGGGLFHYDGSSWIKSTEPNGSSDSLLAVSPSSLWSAGSGRVEHWDGTAWTTLLEQSSLAFPLKLWGSSDLDINVGGSASIFHWDGTSWSEQQTGGVGGIVAATSVGPGAAWVAAGWGGGILRR